MLKFKFQINKYYLLCHALAGGKEKKDTPFSGWINLTERLYRKSKEVYALITGVPLWTSAGELIFTKSENFSYFRKVCKLAEELLKKATRSPEFKRLFKETREYLEIVRKQWSKNEKKVFKLLSIITGLKLPSKSVTVLITHPRLRNGTSFPQQNIIGWGHKEEWKNYSTVYLCHELLHILTHNKSKNLTLMHALIELATDNELRIRLNKKGKYFDVKTHKFLLKLEKYILPFWEKYLRDGKEKDIFELEKKLLENKKVRRLIKELEKV